MPEKATKPSMPVPCDTIPVQAYRELQRFVGACGGVEGAYEIAKLLNKMTISAKDLLEGLELMRKR